MSDRAQIVSQRMLYWTGLVAASICCIILLIPGVLSFFNIAAGEPSIIKAIFTGITPLRLVFNLSYLVLLITYLIWLAQKSKEITSFSGILKISWPFLLLAFIAYPLSEDFYLYLQYGWMALHGVNPYVSPSVEFPSFLTPYIAWPNQTSTYGPISLGIFVVSALGTFLHTLVGLYLLKIFCCLFHVLNAGLIWNLLKQSPHGSKSTLAYILNPAIVAAFVADVHVDVFLCTSIILLIGSLYRKWYVFAILATIAGCLTKTLPVIWLPLLGSFLIARSQWKKLGIAAGISIFIMIVISQVALPNASAWTGLLNPGTSGLTSRSFHHILSIGLEKFASFSFEQRSEILNVMKFVGYGVFFAAYFVVLGRIFLVRHYSESNLVIDIGWVTLTLFLFATPWVVSWYSSILFPIALLSKQANRFWWVALTFCLSSTLIYAPGTGAGLFGLVTSLVTLIPVLLSILGWNQLDQKLKFNLPY